MTDTPAPVEPERIYTISEGVKAPKVIRQVKPDYPAVALQLKKNGYVVVECTIDRTGMVRDARVASASFPPFGAAAIEAVRQWQFEPGTLNGRPVDVRFHLTVQFQVTSR